MLKEGEKGGWELELERLSVTELKQPLKVGETGWWEGRVVTGGSAQPVGDSRPARLPARPRLPTAKWFCLGFYPKKSPVGHPELPPPWRLTTTCPAPACLLTCLPPPPRFPARLFAEARSGAGAGSSGEGRASGCAVRGAQLHSSLVFDLLRGLRIRWGALGGGAGRHCFLRHGMELLRNGNYGMALSDGASADRCPGLPTASPGLPSPPLQPPSPCCACFADDVLRVLRCGHRFHLECIDRWLLSSTDYSRPPACPMCNKALDAAGTWEPTGPESR